MKKNNKKGFTLAELLIVVAIIAVLTAIAIPVFTTQLEKSREATDQSNVRSAYAEAMAEYLANGASGQYSATASARQMKPGWEGESATVVTRLNGEEKTITYEAVTSAQGTGFTVTVKSETDGSTTVAVGNVSVTG